MAQKITNLARVLDPWLEAQSDADRCNAVVNAILWIGENLDDIAMWPALEVHPLRRSAEVPGTGVVIRFILTTPNRGAHLLSIEDIA